MSVFLLTDFSVDTIIRSDPGFLDDTELFSSYIALMEHKKHAPQCICAGLEKTQEGKWHLQVALAYPGPKRISTSLKNALPPGVHIEPARSSWKQCKLYCSKGLQSHKEWEEKKAAGPNYGKDARIIVLGVEPARGKQTQYSEICDEMKSGELSLSKVIWEYPDIYNRYHHALRALWAEVEKKNRAEFRQVECHVFWGEAGAGKTREAHERARTIAPQQILYNLTSGDGHNIWFDGYDGETCILIDDFYGQIKYDFFLRLTDGYSVRLNKKGSYTYTGWNYIFITSNDCPCRWWRNMAGRPWDKPAFKRRITSITKFGDVPDCDHEPIAPIHIE